MTTATPFRMVFGAATVLDAVERWATGGPRPSLELFREFKLSEECRVDGLLVPVSWTAAQGHKKSWPDSTSGWARMGLTVVEVKCTRSDFLAGKKRAQLEAYRELPGVMGVYLATPRGIVKRGELPAGIGHLVCGQRPDMGPVAVAVAAPAYRAKQASPETLWRLMFRIRERYQEKARQLEAKRQGLKEQFGAVAARVVGRIERDVAAWVRAEVQAATGRAKGQPWPTDF